MNPMRSVLAIVVAALSSADVSGASYVPDRGTQERAAIADAIREGTHSTAMVVFDHLRVEAGTIKLAFAEVHPARETAAQPFFGWVLLAKSSSRWEMQWAVSFAGDSKCSTLSYAYNTAKRAAELVDADSDFFSAGFNRAAGSIAAQRPGAECSGEIVFDQTSG